MMNFRKTTPTVIADYYYYLKRMFTVGAHCIEWDYQRALYSLSLYCLMFLIGLPSPLHHILTGEFEWAKLVCTRNFHYTILYIKWVRNIESERLVLFNNETTFYLLIRVTPKELNDIEMIET